MIGGIRCANWRSPRNSEKEIREHARQKVGKKFVLMRISLRLLRKAGTTFFSQGKCTCSVRVVTVSCCATWLVIPWDRLLTQRLLNLYHLDMSIVGHRFGVIWACAVCCLNQARVVLLKLALRHPN